MHFISSLFVTLTENGKVNTIQSRKHLAMQLLINLWVDPLSIRVVTFCLHIEAKTFIVRVVDHLVRAWSEIL